VKKMVSKTYRLEKGHPGDIRIPKGAYWGPETQLAIANFPISGYRFPREFLCALGMIKMAAAEANMKLGLLPRTMGKAIRQAAGEVMEGKWDRHFPVDVFQTGSGTSTHTNANEVIARRANLILGARTSIRGVHPNDHVNRGQSSNDVIPSCLHMAAAERIRTHLLPALEEIRSALEEKAREFDPILKIGRTHLQDATPIRLGQEFGGYASMVRHGIKRIQNVFPHLLELALGGTAVGTGINTHPRFASFVIRRINDLTGMRFREAENHFEAQGGKDAVVETSSALKTLAISLMKIANDLRWLSSGPRCGIGEISLPELQAGSSIMPGKINPVIPEALTQVCAQVVGNDTTIAIAAMSGNFELNVMMPVMAHNLLESIALLSTAIGLFTQKCIRGVRANEKRCRESVEKSLALVTALAPRIGYHAAAALAREAHASGKNIRDIAIARGVLPLEELTDLLDPWKMVGAPLISKDRAARRKDERPG
jgi:fumarate hydratase, class II